MTTSNSTICHECKSENAPGSKFCNNCGARLQTSSELICPACQTLNPKNRYYCDACGTRLVKDEFQEAEDASKVDEPSQPSGDVFSLPTRKPGDTGDLDPSALPDWLRTGTSPLDADDDTPIEKPDSGKLPNIEDLTPDKKPTADLPEWLVSEHDSEPIIEPPRSISTDDFMELVGGGTEAGTGIDEEAEVESDASLPDWLTDPVRAVDSQEEDRSSTMQPLPEPSAIDTDQVSDDTGEDDAEDIPGWLADLGPVDTGVLASPLDGESVEQVEEPQEEQLPDWIADLGPPDTSLLSSPLAEQADQVDDSLDVTDDSDEWMADFDLSDTAILSMPADKVSEDAGDTAVFDMDEVAASWPKETDTEDPQHADDLELEQFGSFDSPIPGEGSEDLDWPAESQLPAADDSLEPARLTAEESVEPTEYESEEIPAWLRETGDGQDADTPAPDSAASLGERVATGGEALPAWLLESDSTDLEARPDSIIGPGATSDEVSAAADEEELPDWLADAVEPSTEASIEEETVADERREATASIEHSDLPGWPLESDSEVPTTAQPVTGDFESAPGWFESQTDQVGDADDVIAEDDATVSADVSDWLEELESSESDKLSEEVEAAREGIAGISDSMGRVEDADLGVSDAVESVEPGHIEQADVDSVSVSSWFAELGGDSPPTDSDEGDKLVTALLESDEEMWAGLDWLSREEEVEAAPGAEAPAEAPAVDAEEPELPAEDLLDSDESTLADVPDWLDELADIDLDAVVAEELDAQTGLDVVEQAPVDELPIPAAPAEEEALSSPGGAELPGEPVELPGEDWLSGDDLLEGPPGEQEMPDWLEQLGPPVPEQLIDSQISDEIEPAAEDLPEWVAQLKPNVESEAGSLLPTALGLTDEEESALDDLTDELGAPELPEWLRGESVGDRDVAVGRASAAAQPETADWFKSDELDAFRLDEEVDLSPDSEWSHVLDELPPAVAPQDLLVLADVPEWVEKLKPREMSSSAIESDAALPAEVSGPLAGLAGVVGVESIVSVPRQARPVGGFIVTREQQQHAVLLNRLTQWQQESSTVMREGTISASSLVRLLLSILLVGTIIAGIYLPDLLQSRPAPIGEPMRAMNAAIEAAAGNPVLVAFDYAPALQGELMPQAEILLDQLKENGSTIVYASQHTAGMAMAQAMDLDVGADSLGYLPGESVGLRQLGSCLGGSTPCETIFGRTLDENVQSNLADVGLVILFTGERDSLVYWVEQVGAFNEVPMIAGVTQALAPVAGSYQASGQLSGFVAGRSEGVAYQSQFHQLETAVDLQRQLDSQQLAQLLFAVLLLVGGILYGIGGVRARRSKTTSGVV